MMFATTALVTAFMICSFAFRIPIYEMLVADVRDSWAKDSRLWTRFLVACVCAFSGRLVASSPTCSVPQLSYITKNPVLFHISRIMIYDKISSIEYELEMLVLINIVGRSVQIILDISFTTAWIRSASAIST